MRTHAYIKELSISRAVANRAGRFLRAAQKNNSILKQPHGKGYLDVTTRADIEAERMIIETLTTHFPEDDILSEETRAGYSPKKGRLWIVDPLDGTTNYLKGLDAYAISIALMVDGVVVMAVNHLPVSDDTYFAVRGRGVFRNGKKCILVGSHNTLAQSLVSVGFPHLRTKDVAEAAFALYRDLWLASSDLRRSASAVVDNCILASGYTGAYVTTDIKPWDIASGSLFIEEQGGIATDMYGEPLDLFRKSGNHFSTSVIFAKNTSIHNAIRKITMRYNQ